KRTLRALAVPHFQIDDAIYAEEVQGVRAFGEEVAVESVMSKVAERMAQHTQSLEATEEYGRAGAVKGVITYADGSQLNLFTTFGVNAEAEIDWDLDNANPADGILRKKCAGVIRQVAGILEGLPYTGLHAICGDNFFDDLLQHKEIRDTYKGWSEAQILRESYIGPNRVSYGIFEFGGIVWENYRGGVGATGFVHTDKCHLFPLGVPGLFKTVYSPADYIETVNTLGKSRYFKQFPQPNDKGVNIEAQTNMLPYCTRPKVLIQGKRT
ncbi:MAG: major capsid protein, partial [Thermomicrobiales bacterium]